jgi:hypothetical protein
VRSHPVEKEEEMRTSSRTKSRLVTAAALTLATAAVFAGSAPAAPARAAGGDDQWLEALTIRSEALNRIHGLGDAATTVAAARSSDEWLVALMIRSEALNRLHGLG